MQPLADMARLLYVFDLIEGCDRYPFVWAE
jgi:hypothetical protein